MGYQLYINNVKHTLHFVKTRLLTRPQTLAFLNRFAYYLFNFGIRSNAMISAKKKGFWIAIFRRMDAYSNETKRVLEYLDTNGYCFSWSGPLMCGKWDGHSSYFLNNTVVNYHCGLVWAISQSKKNVIAVASALNLEVESIAECGSRAGWS